MTPKTKRYTRRQIREAIEFWTKILENTSPLIDALVEEFGYDIVFGDAKIVPILKTIEKLYSIINVYAFDSKLKACPIEKDIDGKCLADDASMEFCNVLYTDSKENPTKYIVLDQIGKDDHGNVFYPLRMIVSDEILNSHIALIALTSIVAHEMIHQYVNEIGNRLKTQFESDYVTHKVYDEHMGEFEDWMNAINAKHGLNITKQGSKMTYDQNSVDALKNFTGSDYVNESLKSTDTMKVDAHENGYIEVRYL